MFPDSADFTDLADVAPRRPRRRRVRRLAFAKGHGTENDFVLIEDPEDNLELSAEQIRAICDRRAGIGADGVLRAVANHIEGCIVYPGVWFMDYRNADGSIAEMCGNGVRVFVRYLLDRGLVQAVPGEPIAIGTRDGIKLTELLTDGRIRVAMGATTVLGRDVTVAPAHGTNVAAYRVDVGNPHAVVLVADAAALAELDLTRAPAWAPATAYPDGVNVEFVHRIEPGRIAMRVFERGSGETRSCGTGTCAAVAATAAAFDDDIRPVSYRVDVPGGSVEVELTADETYLTGPAVLVARGEFGLGDDGTLSAPRIIAAHV